MRPSISLLLFVVLLAFSGCLNIIETIVVRPDGSIVFLEDASFDRMILDLLYASREMTSVADSSVGMSDVTPKKSKKVRWDKPKADTILAMIFKSQRERWQGKPYVRSITTMDTATYSGVHFILSAELTNYRFIDSILQKPDTAKLIAKKGKKSKKAKSESLVLEQGDSVRVTFKDISDLGESVMNRLPENSRPPMFNKLSYRLNPRFPNRARKEHSVFKTIGYRSDNQPEGDDTDSSSNPMDSMSKYMGMLSGMMGGMFSLEVNFTAPEILSTDESAEIDTASKTATWTIDASSMMSGQDASGDRYVWFRKPRGQPATGQKGH